MFDIFLGSVEAFRNRCSWHVENTSRNPSEVQDQEQEAVEPGCKAGWTVGPGARQESDRYEGMDPLLE